MRRSKLFLSDRMSGVKCSREVSLHLYARLVDGRVDVGEASSSACVCIYVYVWSVRMEPNAIMRSQSKRSEREENRRISINRSILITVCL